MCHNSVVLCPQNIRFEIPDTEKFPEQEIV